MRTRIAIMALMSLAAASSAGEPGHCRIAKLANLPIEFAQFQPTLLGKFNGVDLKLVMDSGASTTVLFPSAVAKAGLDESHSDIESVGVGGKSRTLIARADEVEIGPSRGERVRFLEALSVGVAADGLLGADYLFRTDLELNLRDNEVTFIGTDGDCDEAGLAYWDRTASWVESRDMSGVSDRRQKVEVEINGRPTSALLDTGATHSVLDLEAASWIGLTPETPGVTLVGEVSGVGANKMRVWRAPLDSFAIGDESIRHTSILIGDFHRAGRPSAQFGAPTQPDLILGADFMRAHHLLFARSQRRLYFSYLGGRVFSLEASP